MQSFTVKEIQEKLQVHYYPKDKSDPRNLHIHKVYDNYEKIGSIFFSLEGSPPKGYAIYVPGHCALWFYDAWGRRWQNNTNCEVEDIDEFQDIDILKEST